MTAVSPVAHHCAVIEHARLPGVDTRCARFEDVLPEQAYDLLLFSESINHFALTDEFLKHCEAFLVRSGFMLIADDLSEDRAHFVETQTVFRVMRSIDITPHVAPTVEWWAAHLPVLAAYRTALLSILEVHDRELADRVRDVLQSLGESELKLLFSGETSAPPPKGRYMIYLLQRE